MSDEQKKETFFFLFSLLRIVFWAEVFICLLPNEAIKAN